MTSDAISPGNPSIEQIDQFIEDEYRSYLMCEMLCEITCYPASETFAELSRELADFRGISPNEASALLLPVAASILDGARKGASQGGCSEAR